MENFANHFSSGLVSIATIVSNPATMMAKFSQLILISIAVASWTARTAEGIPISPCGGGQDFSFGPSTPCGSPSFGSPIGGSGYGQSLGSSFGSSSMGSSFGSSSMGSSFGSSSMGSSFGSSSMGGSYGSSSMGGAFGSSSMMSSSGTGSSSMLSSHGLSPLVPALSGPVVVSPLGPSVGNPYGSESLSTLDSSYGASSQGSSSGRSAAYRRYSLGKSYGSANLGSGYNSLSQGSNLGSFGLLSSQRSTIGGSHGQLAQGESSMGDGYRSSIHETVVEQSSSVPQIYVPQVQPQPSSVPQYYAPQPQPTSGPQYYAAQPQPTSGPQYYAPQPQPTSGPQYYAPQPQPSSVPQAYVPQSQPQPSYSRPVGSPTQGQVLEHAHGTFSRGSTVDRTYESSLRRTSGGSQGAVSQVSGLEEAHGTYGASRGSANEGSHGTYGASRGSTIEGSQGTYGASRGSNIESSQGTYGASRGSTIEGSQGTYGTSRGSTIEGSQGTYGASRGSTIEGSHGTYGASRGAANEGTQGRTSHGSIVEEETYQEVSHGCNAAISNCGQSVQGSTILGTLESSSRGATIESAQRGAANRQIHVQVYGQAPAVQSPQGTPSPQQPRPVIPVLSPVTGSSSQRTSSWRSSSAAEYAAAEGSTTAVESSYQVPQVPLGPAVRPAHHIPAQQQPNLHSVTVGESHLTNTQTLSVHGGSQPQQPYRGDIPSRHADFVETVEHETRQQILPTVPPTPAVITDGNGQVITRSRKWKQRRVQMAREGVTAGDCQTCVTSSNNGRYHWRCTKCYRMMQTSSNGCAINACN